jgi:hypothetical protein
MSLYFTYSNSFSNVLNTDLVLRTAENTQKLVLGTGFGTHCNAALYIKDNRIGFHKPPSDGYLIDFKGIMNVDDSYNMNILTNMIAGNILTTFLSVDPSGLFTSGNNFLSNISTYAISGTEGTLSLGNSNTVTINIGQTGSQAINIGGYPAQLNIGNPNDTLNFSGTSLNINTSSVSFGNKLIRLNSSSNSGSGGVGLDIFEDDTSVGYIKTSSDKRGFVFKSPLGSEFSLNLHNSNVSLNNQLVIQNNGNVGIGTVQASHRLSVLGDASVSSTLSSQNLSVSQTSSLSNVSASNLSTISLVCSNMASQMISVSNLTINSSVASVGNQNGKYIVANIQPNDHQICAIGYSNNAMKFQVNDTSTPFIFSQGQSSASSVEVMRLNNTGLGIGTSLPLTTLDVNGATTVRGMLSVSRIGAYNSNLYLDPSGASDWTYINSINSNGAISMLSKHVLTTSNFGINTVNPQSALDVNGAGSMRQLTVSANDGVYGITGLKGTTGQYGGATMLGERIRYNSNTENFTVISNGTDCGFSAMISTQGMMRFYTGIFQGQTGNYALTPTNLLSLERMTITNAGVGIGTNSPQTPLHVQASGRNVVLRLQGSSNFSQGIDFYDNNGTTWSVYKPPNTSHLRFSNGTNDLITFQNTGYVGIGVTEPLAKFHVYDSGTEQDVLRAENGNGSMRFTANGQLKAYSSSGFNYFTAIANVSDRRLKEDVKPISNALAKIEKLQGVSFKFKREFNIEEGTQIGFIAQDVCEVCPEFVQQDDETNIMHLKYEKMTALLVEGIKDMQHIIKNQQKEIEHLKKIIHS